jgi:2-dehydropantoate 2-reductase
MTKTNLASPSLRIAVIGAGGIGSAFAFQLATAGHHDVTVVARPRSARLAQLKHDKGIVRTDGDRAVVTVCDVLDAAAPYDLIIVTLQAHRLDSVMPAIQASTARSVLFAVNNFHPEQLQQMIGHERCAFAMPFIQATIQRDGRLAANISTVGPKSRIGREDLVLLFNQAGIPAVFEAQMPLWLICHVPVCIAFESVAVAAVNRGGGAAWNEAMKIAMGMKESFTLIKRLGYPLYPSGKALLDRSPATLLAVMLWCMSRVPSFRTLLALGADEARALVAALVSASAETVPPVTVSYIAAIAPAVEASAVTEG